MNPNTNKSTNSQAEPKRLIVKANQGASGGLGPARSVQNAKNASGSEPREEMEGQVPKPRVPL